MGMNDRGCREESGPVANRTTRRCAANLRVGSMRGLPPRARLFHDTEGGLGMFQSWREV